MFAAYIAELGAAQELTLVDDRCSSHEIFESVEACYDIAEEIADIRRRRQQLMQWHQRSFQSKSLDNICQTPLICSLRQPSRLPSLDQLSEDDTMSATLPSTSPCMPLRKPSMDWTNDSDVSSPFQSRSICSPRGGMDKVVEEQSTDDPCCMPRRCLSIADFSKSLEAIDLALGEGKSQNRLLVLPRRKASLDDQDPTLSKHTASSSAMEAIGLALSVYGSDDDEFLTVDEDQK